MLVGLLVISILAGGLATGTVIALSLPVWIAVLAYPIGGTVALLVGAALTLAPRLSEDGRQEIRNRSRV
jgi:hypothetical protein